MTEAIGVKEAVARAFQIIKELIPENKLQDLALEEVEFDEDHSLWLVTLGYDTTRLARKNPLAQVLPLPEETIVREYKQIGIDAKTGNFVAMKIRRP